MQKYKNKAKERLINYLNISVLFLFLLFAWVLAVSAQESDLDVLEERKNTITDKFVEVKDQKKEFLQNKREKFEERVEKVREAKKEKLEKFKDRLEGIKDEKKRKLIERINTNLQKLNEKRAERGLGLLDKLEQFLDRIESIIDNNLSNEDIDLSNFKEDLNNLRLEIESLRNDLELQKEKDYIVEITDENNLGQAVSDKYKQLVNDYKEIKNRFIELKKDIKQLVNDLKVTIRKSQSNSDSTEEK